MARERLRQVHPQRPVDFNEKAVQKILDATGYVYVQPKYDGFRCLVFLDGRDVRAVTREGFEIVSLRTRYPVLKEFFNRNPQFANKALDCEVWLPVVLVDDGFDTASGLLRRDEAIASDVHVEFTVFDIIPVRLLFGDKDCPQVPLHKRIPELRSVNVEWPGTRLTYSPTYTCSSSDEIQEVFQNMRKAGYEGAVVKDPAQLYKAGKVNGWFKLKPNETQDGTVIGFVDGDKGNKGKLVGFVVRLESGAEVRATGITRELMTAITADPEAYKGRCVEVSAMEASTQGKLRHPKFLRFRDLDNSKGVKV